MPKCLIEVASEWEHVRLHRLCTHVANWKTGRRDVGGPWRGCVCVLTTAGRSVEIPPRRRNSILRNSQTVSPLLPPQNALLTLLTCSCHVLSLFETSTELYCGSWLLRVRLVASDHHSEPVRLSGHVSIVLFYRLGSRGSERLPELPNAAQLAARSQGLGSLSF